MAKGQITRTEIKTIHGRNMRSSETAGLKNMKNEGVLKRVCLKNAGSQKLRSAKRAKDEQELNLLLMAQARLPLRQIHLTSPV